MKDDRGNEVTETGGDVEQNTYRVGFPDGQYQDVEAASFSTDFGVLKFYRTDYIKSAFLAFGVWDSVYILGE